MEPTDIITLRSFLIALVQLDSPLPQEQQEKLNAIAPNIMANLGKLDAIAESYPPLDALYQEAGMPEHDHAKTRTKADLPTINYAAEQQSTETSNTLVAKIVAKIENLEEEKLHDLAKKVCENNLSPAQIAVLLASGYLCP